MSVVDLAGGVVNFVLGMSHIVPMLKEKFAGADIVGGRRAYRRHWSLGSGVCRLYGLCAEEPARVDYQEEELSGLNWEDDG